MEDLETKITNAMHRIEELYYEKNGKCYLSFSGGKDSTVILALIKMCEDILTIPKDGIPAIFCNTGLELQATVDFVNFVKENYYQNVVIIRPEKTFNWIIQNKGKPMKSKIKSEFIHRYQNGNKESPLRNLLGKNKKRTKIANKDMHILHPNFDIKVSASCCTFLKKKPFEKYNKENNVKGYIVGERIEEGGVRELTTIKRVSGGGKLCTKTSGNYIVKLPIIDWTNQDIEAFIKKYNVPLSKAYTEYGCERTGCFLCPFSLQLDKNLEQLYKYEPNRYKAAMFFLKDVYIAQNVILKFDEEYEHERKQKWFNDYENMRYEMLKKYRPEICEKFNNKQMSLFD